MSNLYLIDDVATAISPETLANATWIGALSFEARSSATLGHFASENLRLHRGLLVSYETEVTPQRVAMEQRQENRKTIEEYSSRVFEQGVEEVRLSAYVFDSMFRTLERRFQKGEPVDLVVDISCLTKIHVIALAAFVGQYRCVNRIFISYAVPENYGFLDSELEVESAWQDIIIAPLGETGLLFNESSSQGVIIPGHESHRLVVAIGEIEPAGGLIILPELQGRPDLRHLMLRRNQRLLHQLERMASRTWTEVDINVVDLERLSKELYVITEKARYRKSPVVLFPFGPKSLVFAAAYQLGRDYAEASWFVYPVPVSYDVNYSFGIDRLFWFGQRGAGLEGGSVL